MEKEKKNKVPAEVGEKTEKSSDKPKKPGKKDVVGGYTRKQYEAALAELDPEEKDFFDRSDYTETQSTVSAVIKALVYIIAILAVSVAVAVFAISCANDIFAFVKEDKTVEVVIPEYVTTEELSEILGEAGAINYPWLFRFYCSLKDVDSSPAYNFVAGTYTVATNMNYDTLMLSFVERTTLTTVRLTLPEGSTLDEMVAVFEANGCSTREKFLECLETYDFAAEYDFLKNVDATDRYYLLEGYLYPDTYDFYTGRSPEYYLCRLLDQFEKVCRQSSFFKMAEESDYSLDELMTIASIIEKEAYHQNDFDIVSSVIHNRLKNPETYAKLECDSTIVYALSCIAGHRVTDITLEDLELDNPYNSYKEEGLPPGPICNPSFNSIACAFEPAKTEETYYYFVSDKNGIMYYATNLKDHEKNIAEIKKAEAEAEAQ